MGFPSHNIFSFGLEERALWGFGRGLKLPIATEPPPTLSLGKALFIFLHHYLILFGVHFLFVENTLADTYGFNSLS